MKQEIFESLKRELVNGYAKKRHPFRYFTLATLHQNIPNQRTVVLRKLLPDFSLLFYTDLRSQKVSDIASNNAVSALFYHPKQMIQVKMTGKALKIDDPDEIERYWKAIPEHSRKDYGTTKAPGTELKNPDSVSYDESSPHFCALRILPETIDYLQLQRPNHLRIRFTRMDNDWNGEFIVP